MAGKFVRKHFSEIDVNDPFFDSLKKDYPGNSNSTSFAQWFQKKARENKTALVFEDDQGIGAFICIKPSENEEIRLMDGRILPPRERVKISTVKIDERYRNQRIGEGALGLTLWEWRDLRIQEIYLTVFEKHTSLIRLLEKYGFSFVGKNLNNERVYIKDRRRISFSDPCKAFPFINGNLKYAGCIAVDMEYHDTMFASSELANTLQERVDISVANGLKKVYIGSPLHLAFQAGDPVFIYRKYTGTHGSRGYKSCITSFCIVTRIEQVKINDQFRIDYSRFLELVGNKSVFSEHELKEKYSTMRNLTLIELLYCGFFGAGNNVNWIWLNNNGCEFGTHPMNCRYSKDQFVRIMREGNIDVENVVIN